MFPLQGLEFIYFCRTKCWHNWHISSVLHSAQHMGKISNMFSRIHWRWMIVAEESIKRRMKIVFRKCQSNTYSIYCPFGPERHTVTIFFVRLVMSGDTDLLLMAHIGLNPLMLSGNMTLKGSREKPSTGKDSNKAKRKLCFHLVEMLYLFWMWQNKICIKIWVKNIYIYIFKA